MQWILIGFQTEKSSFWILEKDNFLFENPWISIPSWIMATTLKNSNLNGIKKNLKKIEIEKQCKFRKLVESFVGHFL